MQSKSLLLSFLFLFLSFISFAQNELLDIPPNIPFDKENKIITYSQVIEVPGVKQSDLFVISKKFYIDKMKGKVKDIDLEDKENGSVLIKAVYFTPSAGKLITSHGPSACSYDLEFKIKEGKVKIIFSPKKWEEFDPQVTKIIAKDNIPLSKGTGLFKKNEDKIKIKFYEDMHAYISEQLNDMKGYFKEEGNKAIKNNDF